MAKVATRVIHLGGRFKGFLTANPDDTSTIFALSWAFIFAVLGFTGLVGTGFLVAGLLALVGGETTFVMLKLKRLDKLDAMGHGFDDFPVLLASISKLELLPAMHANLARLDIESEREQLIRERYRGLVRVEPEFNDADFEKHILDPGTTEVRILQTWAPNLDRHTTSIYRAILEHDTNVKILLTNPFEGFIPRYRSAALMDRPNGSGPDVIEEPIVIAQRIMENLEHLSRLYAQLQSRRKEANLEVRVHSSLTPVSLYQAGDWISVGFFLHGAKAVEKSQLILARDGWLMTEMFNREFETIWDRFGVVNLEMPRWAEHARSLA